jgi:hypothetical protein
VSATHNLPVNATYTKDHTTMAHPPTTRARAHWHVDRATSLPEIWACIAVYAGLVGAWRLMGVCRAARTGVKEFLGTLPGLVVVYGRGTTTTVAGMASNVWRLDLASLRWAPIPSLLLTRFAHTCCVVRRSVAVVGGVCGGTGATTTVNVEVLSPKEGAAITSLPPLSCGTIYGAAAIAVEESQSAAGQVLLLGAARSISSNMLSAVQLVDLATGVCTLQPHLLRMRAYPAAARLPDGRVVCAGGIGGESSAEVWGPPEQGAHDTAWTWTQLSDMSVARYDCKGCVMSDGRFAVLGGYAHSGPTSSCEALTLGDGAHWRPLPSMHDGRVNFACAAVAGCIIVAGGHHRQSAEMYDEVLGRWLRLPHDLPHVGLLGMSSALL